MGSLFDIVDQTMRNATRELGLGVALRLPLRVAGGQASVTQNTIALNCEFSSQTPSRAWTGLPGNVGGAGARKSAGRPSIARSGGDR
jgi:hypothetical protein